ncbi:hypothetical protein [Streptomyces cylindrosporus]|uniref:Uncharacterized protein n=1 Tax=Streptomyces cylindrosporus TaxID=2927583 RepID=A0ABS9YR33_9ACTN|nr:hypothetical protein [Streptomyces cylindrosporus]MCI3279160.1 hypothetical protein [Streptomyces cylindrosporus]
MSSTVTEQAVVGRRIEFTYYRDLNTPNPPRHPGTITALIPDQGACVKLRLDGTRHSLHVPPDYEGLTYLDEILPVPVLPMGRFTPTVEQMGGEWAGVPVCLLQSEPTGAEHVIALTADPAAARTAVTSYLTQTGWDLDYVDLDQLELRWAVFEWGPEDDDIPWTANWDACEGDEQAIRIHLLPLPA